MVEEKKVKEEKVEDKVIKKPTTPTPDHPPQEEAKVEEKKGDVKKEKETKEEKSKKELVKDEEKEIQEEAFDPYEIIKYPLSTEKSIRQIEFDNKLVFAVHPRATKVDVRKAVEELFKVKVAKVNIQNSFQGQKRAYVKLGPESLASDVSADLGLI